MKQYFDKIYTKGFQSFCEKLEVTMVEDKKMFVITANPETLMIGTESESFNKILLDDNTTIVPDGIGVVKAGNYLGYPIKERVTGVEISKTLLELLDKNHKSIYLFGAKQEVLDALINEIHKNYSGVVIAGSQNGYVANKEQVFEDIIEKQPDVVLVALGIPQQERLIGKFWDRVDKGIYVGVGGSFDVLSGTKKRAPEFFIKLNIEWLYRIAKEPKRLGRFFKSNVRFIFRIIKVKKNIKG